MGRTLVVLAAALALAVPVGPAAAAGTGGVPAGEPRGKAAPPTRGQAGAGNGGTAVGQVPPTSRRKPTPAKKKRKPRASSPPLLRTFALDAKRLYGYGRTARLTFEIAARDRTVPVKLVVRRAGERAVAAVIDLGERRTGVRQRVTLDGFAAGRRLPQGALDLRLSARDRAGNTLRAPARASTSRRLELYWHRFPLRGRFSWGGEGSRFGAQRDGHSHQGQDLSAPAGTPVVAPRGGVVKVVGYQAKGAGHYVVVGGFGERRDYVFMHLQRGSIAVREGQRVRTGQVLARVGNTGASSGPHLHFEIWAGGWYEGGRPIDPLPLLRRWARWS